MDVASYPGFDGCAVTGHTDSFFESGNALCGYAQLVVN